MPILAGLPGDVPVGGSAGRARSSARGRRLRVPGGSPARASAWPARSPSDASRRAGSSSDCRRTRRGPAGLTMAGHDLVRVERQSGQGTQQRTFLLEAIHGAFPGRLMETHVGHFLAPADGELRRNPPSGSVLRSGPARHSVSRTARRPRPCLSIPDLAVRRRSLPDRSGRRGPETPDADRPNGRDR